MQLKETIQKRVQDCEEFKTEIKDECKKVTDTILSIKEKLQKKVFNHDTEQGYLVHKIKAYFLCFKTIDMHKLEEVFDEDVKFWQDKLE